MPQKKATTTKNKLLFNACKCLQTRNFHTMDEDREILLTTNAKVANFDGSQKKPLDLY